MLLVSLLASASIELSAMWSERVTMEQHWGEEVISAASFSNFIRMRGLIDQGADINATTVSEKKSALMVICDHVSYQVEALEMAKFLLENKADPNLPDHIGQTALNCAAKVGHAAMCKLLIKHGARVDGIDKAYGATALFLNEASHRVRPLKRFEDTVWTLITTISSSERKRIRNTTIRAKIVAAQLAFKKIAPGMPLDVRKKISYSLLDDLVHNQMDRIEQLLSMQDFQGHTAKKNAKYGRPTISKMLDLNDSESRERIRLQVETNIKRIVRGRRPKPIHYDVLQVSHQASADEIEAAYRKAYLKLRKAYAVLSDGAKRNAYDEAIAPDQVAEPMDEKE